MSDTSTNRNVIPVRTFADDVKRARGETTSTNTDISTNKPVEEKKEKKKIKTKSKPKPKQQSKKNVPKQQSKLKHKIARKSAYDYLSKKIDKKNTKIDETHSRKFHKEVSVPSDVILDELEHVGRSEKVSILSDVETSYKEELGGGTIIKDKKRRHFRLIPAIFSAIGSWFGEKKHKHSKSREPKHTISKAETRLETIKAAAQASKHAPEEDYDTVSERLKKIKRERQQSGIYIKEASVSQEPSWTHIIGDKPSDEIIGGIHTDVELLKETPKTDVPIELGDKSEAIYTDIKDETKEIQDTTEDQGINKPEVKQKHNKITIPKPTKTFLKHIQEAGGYKKQKHNKIKTSKEGFSIAGIPIYVFIVVLLFITLIGVGVGFYLIERAGTVTDKAKVIETKLPDTLVDSNNKIRIPLEPNRKNLFETMVTAERQSGVINTFVFVNPDEDSLASIQQFMSILTEKSSDSFTRSLKNIDIGFAIDESPFIIIKGTDFDTVFGGLLAWEATMSRDLDPFFGSTIYESRSLDTKRVVPAYFSDVVIAGKSARVLTDDKGNERLMYIFVTDTLVIITTSRESVTGLLPHIVQ